MNRINYISFIEMSFLPPELSLEVGEYVIIPRNRLEPNVLNLRDQDIVQRIQYYEPSFDPNKWKQGLQARNALESNVQTKGGKLYYYMLDFNANSRYPLVIQYHSITHSYYRKRPDPQQRIIQNQVYDTVREILEIEEYPTAGWKIKNGRLTLFIFLDPNTVGEEEFMIETIRHSPWHTSDKILYGPSTVNERLAYYNEILMLPDTLEAYLFMVASRWRDRMLAKKQELYPLIRILSRFDGFSIRKSTYSLEFGNANEKAMLDNLKELIPKRFEIRSITRSYLEPESYEAVEQLFDAIDHVVQLIWPYRYNHYLPIL